MIRIALQMLVGTRAKYLALIFGTTVTAFLVTFAASFFCGMMTRGFALIAENPSADVWVMDGGVQCVEQTIGLATGALERIRSVKGVRSAIPMAIASADVRFSNGRFQPVQLIGIDDATLSGVPPLEEGSAPLALRRPDAAIVAEGGTDGKLQTPTFAKDSWKKAQPNLGVETRLLKSGDELIINDARILVVGRAAALPRFPPRPLVYTTYSNSLRILPIERHRITFVLATAMPGVSPPELAERIAAQTGLRARSSQDFKSDTVWWYLKNSEDVGDVGAMLAVALLVGLGVTGVMLFLFTQDNLRYYAVLSAMGTRPRILLMMVLIQAAFSACLGTGIGIGLCATGGYFAEMAGVPFRMMWFTPVVGGAAVMLVSLIAAIFSIRPVMKLEPAIVFSFR